MRIRHLHGDRIRALCPPVSVKLENVFLFVGFSLVVHGWGGGGAGGGAQRHKDFGVGVILGVGVGTEINRVLMKMMMEARGQILGLADISASCMSGQHLERRASACEEEEDAAVLLGHIQIPAWVWASSPAVTAGVLQS